MNVCFLKSIDLRFELDVDPLGDVVDLLVQMLDLLVQMEHVVDDLVYMGFVEVVVLVVEFLDYLLVVELHVE